VWLSVDGLPPASRLERHARTPSGLVVRRAALPFEGLIDVRPFVALAPHPHQRLGRYVRFDLDRLSAWLEGQGVLFGETRGRGAGAAAGAAGSGDDPSRVAGAIRPLSQPAVAVAPREACVTRGPTAAVVGLYVHGGPLRPDCPQEPSGPDGGAVTVSARGKVVAREMPRAAGKLFVLTFAPGNCTLGGRITNGVRLAPASVTVRKGYTVRRDLFEDVP